MDAFRPLSGLALLFLLVGAVRAQTETDLALFSTVSGSLASGNTDTWTFSAADGAMLSFEVRSVSGDLDPVLTLSNGSGTFSLSNDDRNYPDSRDPLLEAITIPRTDTYSLTVSAYGDTSGDYQLTMLPGYARLDQEILFDDASVWTSNLDDQQMLLGNNRMALVLSGLQERAIVIDSTGSPQNDQFLRVDIPELTGPNGWQVGLVARQQDQTDYYLYSLNQNGQWQFSVNTADGERILRDWSSHPAIVAGQPGISLGMLANGSDFEFFYNDQLIGHVSDDTLQRAGQAGLMAATPPVIGSELTAQFERFTITTPAPDTSYPQQIQTGSSSVMISAVTAPGSDSSQWAVEPVGAGKFSDLQPPRREPAPAGRQRPAIP